MTFYAVISSGISTMCPRQMQIPEQSFYVLRGKSKLSHSLRLTQHCRLALPAPERHLELPNEPNLREITTFAIGNLSKYFLVKGVCEQVMKRGTEASFQTGSSSSWVTQQDKWDQHWLWAGATQCWASAWGDR